MFLSFVTHIYSIFMKQGNKKKYFFHLVYIFSFHTCDEFSCDEWPSMSWPIAALKCTLYSLFSCLVSYTRILYCAYVHYIEVFFVAGTKKSVHCSELGGVHYIEVYLQQKSIGGTRTCVQRRGVHFIEVLLYMNI